MTNEWGNVWFMIVAFKKASILWSFYLAFIPHISLEIKLKWKACFWNEIPLSHSVSQWLLWLLSSAPLTLSERLCFPVFLYPIHISSSYLLLTLSSAFSLSLCPVLSARELLRSENEPAAQAIIWGIQAAKTKTEVDRKASFSWLIKGCAHASSQIPSNLTYKCAWPLEREMHLHI